MNRHKRFTSRQLGFHCLHIEQAESLNTLQKPQNTKPGITGNIEYQEWFCPRIKIVYLKTGNDSKTFVGSKYLHHLNAELYG